MWIYRCLGPRGCPTGQNYRFSWLSKPQKKIVSDILVYAHWPPNWVPQQTFFFQGNFDFWLEVFISAIKKHFGSILIIFMIHARKIDFSTRNDDFRGKKRLKMAILGRFTLKLIYDFHDQFFDPEAVSDVFGSTFYPRFRIRKGHCHIFDFWWDLVLQLLRKNAIFTHFRSILRFLGLKMTFKWVGRGFGGIIQ